MRYCREKVIKWGKYRKNMRYLLAAALVLACAFGLTGCVPSDFAPVWFVSWTGGETESKEEETAAETVAAEESAASSAVEAESVAADATAGSVLAKGEQRQDYLRAEESEVEEKESGFIKDREDERRAQIGLSEEGVAELLQSQSENYYFGQLDGEKSTLYVEIYQILTRQAEEILLSTDDAFKLPQVYQAVINDHPELFYLNGYTYTRYMRQGKVKYITFSGRYLYDEAEVVRRQAAIDQVVAQKMAELVKGDDYGTVKAVYEYLIFSTEYSLDSPDNQNICSVFLDGKSVCNGYAKAAQYLLNRCGIPCIIVNGTALGNAHAWNIVRMNGRHYQMDATWGDPSYKEGGIENADGVPGIDYGYLGVTTDEMGRSHRADNAFALPVCDAVEDNYYVREGLYLSGFDEERVAEIFAAARARGENTVSIKAADRLAYREIYDKLIDGQKIFNYFGIRQENGEYKIAYSGNEDLCTVSFWE